MDNSDEGPSRFSFTVDHDWLKQLDQWRVNQPRTLSRAEAVRRLVDSALSSEAGRAAAKGEKKPLPTALERNIYLHAKTTSSFNGVVSILSLLVAKKLIDHKELARIHESMSAPFSGKFDEGRSLIAGAQRRLDAVLAMLGRRSLRTRKPK